MRKEVKIGIIGITAIAMLFFGINYLKGVRMFHASSYYYVEYTDINGLSTSSPVFFAFQVQDEIHLDVS